MAASDPLTIIRQYAPRYGLDPRAVVAYALTQGGVHWGARGDQGTSFGPFQLHRGGALGTHDEAWANSPQGLIAAMGMMSRAGAKGRSGPDAAAYIVGPSFGRGANPASDEAKARAAYSRAAALIGGGGSSSAPGQPFPRGNALVPQTPQAVAATPVSPPGQVTGPPPQQLIGQALMKMFATRGGSIAPALDLAKVLDSRAQQQAPQAPTPTPATAPKTAVALRPPTGAAAPSLRLKNGLTPQIATVAKKFDLSVTSGFRSVQRQAQIYATRTSDSSVAKPGKSYHNSGRAIDVAPNAEAMKFLAYAFAHPGQFKEVFYDPAGRYIKNGVIVKGSIGGHSDHVHIAR